MTNRRQQPNAPPRSGDTSPDLAAALGTLLLPEPELVPVTPRPRSQAPQTDQRLTPDIPCNRLLGYTERSDSTALDVALPTTDTTSTKL